MDVKFEHAVTILLSIQVILLFMTYTIVSDYLTEEDDEYYKDSCSCYCDYPYYWYGYDGVYEVPIGILEGEDNSTGDNSTEEE